MGIERALQGLQGPIHGLALNPYWGSSKLQKHPDSLSTEFWLVTVLQPLSTSDVLCVLYCVDERTERPESVCTTVAK